MKGPPEDRCPSTQTSSQAMAPKMGGGTLKGYIELLQGHGEVKYEYILCRN